MSYKVLHFTWTGDGYDTTGTEKVSQSEAEVSSTQADSPITVTQAIPKTSKRGLFVEVKGQDVNRAIYGANDMGSIRGVPGQVRYNFIDSRLLQEVS